MQCEMCGSEDQLFVVDIEGTHLTVCKRCSRHGMMVRAVQPRQQPQALPQKPKTEQHIMADYAERMRKKREALGLNHEDFAKKVTEKVSLIHKIETSSFEPPIPMARKFEHLLGIRLVEQVDEQQGAQKVAPSGQLTIGDLIKLRKH
ncbi:MAG: multiprotein bridging factor aMBF1 [Nanoarchaeota archaeon]